MASQSQQVTEQASAIPFRWKKGRLEFCLITSVRKGRWGFPKGMIDPGETHIETALKESHEEAGLLGEIVGHPLGSYEYTKWGLLLNVTVLLMRVTHTEEDWDEQHLRRRCWVAHSKARRLLEKSVLRDLLDDAAARIHELGD